MNSKNVLKDLAVKDLEAAVDFNCKIWVKAPAIKEAGFNALKPASYF